ncbi:inositol oxygenase-like [Oppia nitens]|uniref:inositol oxygenase-like n=1 Tax=Oppia nitens TaxID=1686743 RepID=UPI0023DC1D5E|nr:inositol oxygenase-like [Oppia nitens]
MASVSIQPSLDGPIFMVDPSQNYRPDYKDEADFRVYNNNDKDDEMQQMIYETYRQMHERQTVQFVTDRTESWTQFDTIELPIMEALEKLNTFVDESDPDISLPNMVHAFQTAEGIRKVHPDLDWFHLTGLIHDLGKIMAIYGEPQWAVVGDTFPVGCDYGPSIVYVETFAGNPDRQNPVYCSANGMYRQGCGLESVMMSWGHDEYMYRVLKNHRQCKLPDEALYMIRYHSFYPWHRGGDYNHLCSPKDLEMLPWIREFNKFDLYSKCPDLPDMETLIPYYQSLIDKYIPGKVKF